MVQQTAEEVLKDEYVSIHRPRHSTIWLEEFLSLIVNISDSFITNVELLEKAKIISIEATLTRTRMKDGESSPVQDNSFR